MQPIKQLFLILIFTFISLLSFAGTIKGKVMDAQTGEPMVGATVILEGTKYVTAVNLDGTYSFKNIPNGKYEVKIKIVGYKKPDDVHVEVKENNDTAIADFKLENESVELGQVIIQSGKNKESDKAVRGIEKKADIVLNIMSQNAIQLSPDVTVANTLQRISGVAIERSSSGEGRYAIIRGLDQRYNNTLVNGIKIPSPDDKFRYVPMDLFPSDLLERLEVIKSLTPSMEGDAIGGTMNLVMKNAPDKLKFNIHIAGGYNTLFSDRPFSGFSTSGISKKDPIEKNGTGYVATDADFSRSNLDFKPVSSPVNKQIGFTLGNRFLKKRLGIVLGGSYQDMYRGSNNIFNQQYAQPTIAVVNGTRYDNYPLFSDSYVREYSTHQKRFALNNKWDYIINHDNKLSLFNFYTHMDELQSRYSIDSNVNTNRGNVSELFRSRWQKQDIYNSTLQGTHILSKSININWSAVYSYAKQIVPDQAEFEVTNSINVTPTVYTLKGMTRKWLHNSDKDLAGYFNLNYTPQVNKTKVEFAFGGLFRHKTRDNYYNDYNLSSKGTQTFTNATDAHSIYNAQYNFNPAAAGIGNIGNGSTYTVKEDIAAGYVQAKFMATKKLQLLGGVRIEYTNDNYNTALPLTTPKGVYGHIWYTDILPSLHLKYSLTEKQNLRLSYFRSLSRPGFHEFTPYLLPNPEFFDEQGNPFIKHTTADNYDFRYEFFPGGADQVLIGGFYKRIYNPIETGFTRTPTTGGNSIPGSLYLTPLNFGDATNYGAEFVITKYFGKVGINANYTYTHSAITTERNYLFYDEATGRPDTKILTQTRPLQGQAKHIGNVSLLLKAQKLGLDAQLAFVYTGERVIQVSQYYGLDSWQQPFSQLDFSFEQKVVKHFSVYAKINNLTNSKTKVVIKQPNILDQTLNKITGQESSDQIFIQRDLYKLSFLFGIRYKL